MSDTLNILALPGSLRRGSITKVLLETAAEVAPDTMNVTVFTLNEIPVYNNDIEQESGFPPAVVTLRDAIEAADGLILGTPEYNYSETQNLYHFL